MTRVRKLFAPILLAFAAAPLVALGCSGTGTSETIVPITGITVRAETLTTGHGCGRGATQIFKYAVVVLGRNLQGYLDHDGTDLYDNPVRGNVFDCFTDAAFVDVPQSLSSSAYRMEVFAYNEAAYRAAGGDATIRPLATERNAAGLRATKPTYTTTCSAEQRDLVQALAVCPPLALGAGGLASPVTAPAAVQLSAASFPRAEAGAARCDDDYSFVRWRFKTGSGTLSEAAETRCSAPTTGEPATIVVSPAIAPASYTFEVALLRADRSELGRTTCTADTSPGLTSSAVCLPLP